MIIDGFKKLSVASIILLILFLTFSVVQLILAFLELEKYRRIEKPFCLGLLTAFVAVTLPNHPMLYIATFLGMVGDILVILPKKRFFIIGAIAFFNGFILYALEGILILLGGNISPIALTAIIATYVVMNVVLIFVLGKRLAPNKGEMVGIGLYLSPLFTLIPLMAYLTANTKGVMYLSLIGVIFFLASDLTITFTKYIKKFKRYDFYIMSTYLIGQLLIVMGYVLTYMVN